MDDKGNSGMNNRTTKIISIKKDEVYEMECCYGNYSRIIKENKLIYKGEFPEIEFKISNDLVGEFEAWKLLSEDKEDIVILVGKDNKGCNIKITGKGFVSIQSFSKNTKNFEIDGDIILNLWEKGCFDKPKIRLKLNEEIKLIINQCKDIIKIEKGIYWFDNEIWNENEWMIKEIVE